MDIGGELDSDDLVPSKDGILDMLSGSECFSVMVIVSPEAELFKAKNRQHELSVSPVGVNLMRVMNRAFKPLIGKIAAVYFDKVIIFSKDCSAHAEDLSAVFDQLKENHLLANPSESFFAVRKLSLFGSVVSAEGIQIDPEKVQLITNFPVPKTLLEIRAFHRLVMSYGRFIKNFSVIMAPITKCAQSNSYSWNSQAEESFQALKNKISRAPILGSPDFSKTFRVDFDATKLGIWAVLSQEGRLIAYFSKLLNGSMRNYSIYDLKIYAVVQALGFWRRYLTEKKFILRIDQETLCFHSSRKNSDVKHAKWAVFLQDYDILMSFKAGPQSRKLECQ